MVIGIVDVGGGLRGVYGAGIFDFCMQNNINFDYCIGVSAGSANIASFLANQPNRNYKFYAEYSNRKEYMSFKNFIKTGSYLDLKYIYGDLSNKGGENPLDYDSLKKNPSKFIAVATNAKTGKVKYFTKNDMQQDNYEILMASSCIPAIDKPIYINGVPYYDGALSDPVPIKKAFNLGCDKVVLILTKPVDMIRTPQKDEFISKTIIGKYPKAAEGLALRAKRYNESVEKAKEYEKEGKVLIIAPDDISGMKTLNIDIEAINKLYNKGIKDAEKILNWL